MSLKLYCDLLSQPSRALYIFLKKCNIPFESKIVNLSKGEQFQEGFDKIHMFNKVPAIEHNGFNLIESVAILRYLCREFKVDDHWYPRDSKLQARVDEYLEWQHMNTRLHCGLYFRVKYLIPLMKGKPARPETVATHEGQMIDCLDQIENIWLKDRPFLAGDRVSIADLLGACEIEQPRIAGFDPREGRPNLSAWLNRVAGETHPYYEEAHTFLNKVADKGQERDDAMALKLYFDFISQPSRALYILLKTWGIPFEPRIVKISSADHQSPEYQEVNPFSKLPAIEHDGFKLIESVGIVRYLCREFRVANHWYPESSREQARVDEYLEWQHLNTRVLCSRYFLGTVVFPMLRQKAQRPEKAEEYRAGMIEVIDAVESKWLRDKSFLMGDEISVADVFAACEIEQTRMASYEPRLGRPKLTRWLERVASETAPHYAEAHSYLDRVIERIADRPAHACRIQDIFQ